MKKSTTKAINELTQDLFEIKEEVKEVEEKVSRKFDVMPFGKGRINCTTLDSRISDYLKDHDLYVTTPKGNLTRLGGNHPTDPTKKKKYNTTIITIDMLPAYTRHILRIGDQLGWDRTMDSLATEAQLARVKQFFGLVALRKKNKLFPPDDLDKLDNGEIGRLRSDLEATLVKEGMWDKDNKVETEKAKTLRKKKKGRQ